MIKIAKLKTSKQTFEAGHPAYGVPPTVTISKSRTPNDHLKQTIFEEKKILHNPYTSLANEKV